MALTRLTKIDGGGISTTSDYRVGVITATKFVGPIEAENATFAGNVSIGGTLTYEDVTNIDSVGLITARDGIKVGVGITLDPIGDAEFCGIVTFNNRRSGVAAHFPNNEMLVFGNNYLYGNIRNTGAELTFDALNKYRFNCWDGNSTEQWMGVSGVSGSITLGGYFMGTGSARSPRFQIQGSNHLLKMFSSDPSSTTLTERFSLSQSGINFTGLSTHTGNFDLDGDLDVDGHTNLDNVSVAGVSTFASNVSVGNSITVLGLIQARGGVNNGIKVGSNLRIIDDVNVSLVHQSNASIYLKADNLELRSRTNERFLVAGSGAGNAVGLYHFNGSSSTEKFRVTSSGVTVYGTVVATGADINGDLDVDGHTNLDNVSIAGFTTCGTGLLLNNSIRLRFGNTSNSYIYYDAGSGVTHHQITGGTLAFASNISNSYKYMIRGVANLQTELYYNGSEKLRTTDKGIRVGTGVTIETNGQANFSGITTFHRGIYISEPNNYYNVQTLGIPNLDMPFVLSVNGGGSTGIGTALFTGGYGTRPEVVFEQRHGGNFVDSYPHSAPWKIKWTMPNDNDTTDEQVLIENQVGTGGAFSSFRIKTTDNSTGLRSTLDLASSSSTFWVDNNVALRVNSDGVNIPNWLVHHGDSDTKIGFSQNDKIQLQAGGTTRIQTTSTGAQVDTVLLCYGATGNPGRLRLQEGGALCEIMVARNTDNSSFLYFKNEIGGTVDTRVVLDGSGHLRPHVDSTYDLGITGTRWRNVYADTYYGDGSNLTGIVGVTINNNTDNRVATCTGTTGTLNGESNLTFNGSRLDVLGNTDGNVQASFTRANDGNFQIQFRNESSNNGVGYSQGKFGLFYDSSNSDICGMQFLRGSSTGAGTLMFTTGGSERLRINSNGNLIAGRTDFSYNDTSATNNTFLELYGGTTAGNRGILSLSGRTGSNNGLLGTIWFVNANNAGTSPGSQMKLAAAIQSASYTTNSNSQGNSGAYIQFMTKNQGGSLVERFRLAHDGHLIPNGNNNYDLGSSSNGWRNLYVNDAHFSNKGGSNSVDGTWGDWTLQEGENDVFMINNRTGKKFAITMREVS